MNPIKTKRTVNKKAAIKGGAIAYLVLAAAYGNFAAIANVTRWGGNEYRTFVAGQAERYGLVKEADAAAPTPVPDYQAMASEAAAKAAKGAVSDALSGKAK